MTDDQQKEFDERLAEQRKVDARDLMEQITLATVERVAWAVFGNTMISPSAALVGASNVLVEIASISDPAAAELVSHVRAALTKVPPYRGNAADAIPGKCAQQFIRLATAGEGDAFCAAQMLCATLSCAAPTADPAVLARREAVAADVRAYAKAITDAFVGAP